MQGDVRKAADCERWVQEATARFGRLDVLVNCAAGNFLVRSLPFLGQKGRSPRGCQGQSNKRMEMLHSQKSGKMQ